MMADLFTCYGVAKALGPLGKTHTHTEIACLHLLTSLTAVAKLEQATEVERLLSNRHRPCKTSWCPLHRSV